MFSRSLLAFACFGAIIPLLDGTAGDNKKPSLEESFRQWHAGLAAKVKKDREKVLRSMLPDEKDVQFLFPKHAATLWPLLEKGHETLIANVDQVTKEVTRGKEITRLRLFDMRSEKKVPGGYKKLFEIIPQSVPVFEVHVTRSDEGGGSIGSFVYVHNRWLWIQDLDDIPRALEKLK